MKKSQVDKMNDWIERAEKAERAIAPLEQRNLNLEGMFQEEQAIRRKYHNQIQELKGAIRVYARVRPLIAKEKNEGEHEAALIKSDEFSCVLRRGVKQGERKKDDKVYTFDGVFTEEHTQEHVFKDCKDLIQSAVDGFNVRIWFNRRRMGSMTM
jgi:kinesin family member C1